MYTGGSQTQSITETVFQGTKTNNCTQNQNPETAVPCCEDKKECVFKLNGYKTTPKQ